ncbi:MAG: MFS transporter [Gaiellaceae bacterium]
MRRVTLPLYVGGFLGPFGGSMLIAVIPNVARGLDTSLGYVAAAITAYMVPFAVLQPVSGTVAERLGARRVVRAGYVVFERRRSPARSGRRSGASSLRARSWAPRTRSSRRSCSPRSPR